MKILYHHRVASKDGQYVHIEEIIKSLRGLGHEVIVCEPASIQKTGFGGGSGLVDRVRRYLPGFVHELAELAYSVPDYLKLRRLIRRHRPDVIYERYNLYFLSGLWASRRYQLPLLLEVNAPLFEERTKNSSISLAGMSRWTEDTCWRGADWVLPVTQVLADKIADRGVPVEKIRVIPNGINKRFRADASQVEEVSKRYQLGGKLVLGFTGFVREWHRLDRALRVIAEQSGDDWHLLLVGDGPDRPRLESLARELEITDRFSVTGVVGREDMASHVQCFDIALQPDVVPYASPLKMFEYMALAKPILAPDVPNIREILEDGANALLFNPEDESFTRQLQRLCAEATLRDRLGAGARERLSEASLYWDDNAARIVVLAQKSLEPGNTASSLPQQVP